MTLLKDVIRRGVYGVVGCGVGLVTTIPNIMLGDLGSAYADLSAELGVAASMMFFYGGINGMLGGRYAHKVILLGAMLQASAFIPIYIEETNRYND